MAAIVYLSIMVFGFFCMLYLGVAEGEPIWALLWGLTMLLYFRVPVRSLWREGWEHIAHERRTARRMNKEIKRWQALTNEERAEERRREAERSAEIDAAIRADRRAYWDEMAAEGVRRRAATKARQAEIIAAMTPEGRAEAERKHGSRWTDYV